MSYYGSRSSMERRSRSSRKESTDSANVNGNNNGELTKSGLGSYITNYTRSTESSNRTSSLRSKTGGPRTKSNLVGSMTATFEQLNKDALPPPGNSALKSPSYNRVDNATIISQKPPAAPKLENGTVSNHTPKITSTPKLENGTPPIHSPKTTSSPKLENGTVKHEINDEDVERTTPRAKSATSERRGKQQRKKRMLRQQRRSTGVVRLNESDDEDDKEKKAGNDQNEEKNEEATRKSETKKNTLSNEFSPPPSANSVRTEHERTRSYETSENTTSILKSSFKSPTTSISSSVTTPNANDNVFVSGESTPQSPTMPMLNSSRRRGNRSSFDRFQQDSNEKREIDELRAKLTAAESKITELSKDLEDMETDIANMAEENQKLKRENKMLEDENSSMLMVLKQLRNSKE